MQNLPSFVNMGPRFFDVRDGHYLGPAYDAVNLRVDPRNPLAFVVLGSYGHPLPMQNGAPLRLAIPWKYGYKGAKSIVRIEFLADPPATFWNFLQPEEYGFYSNVNPKHPHPRWSQETENDLGTGARRPTRPYNGYAPEVAGMYDGKEI